MRSLHVDHLFRWGTGQVNDLLPFLRIQLAALTTARNPKVGAEVRVSEEIPLAVLPFVKLDQLLE